ncbi:MAG: DUF1934 domain-containing protein [Oscillospiraceae bacterium]
MKAKDVYLTLVSTQSDGSEEQQTELFTSANYEKTADGYRISYDESDATGFKGAKTTLTTFGESRVVMERSGDAKSQLILEKGRKHHCHYGTPYGDFMLGVTASEIRSSLMENGGSLKFKYVIDINSGYLGDFEVDIKIRNAANGLES